MKADEIKDAIGWTRVGAVVGKGRATVTLRPGDDGIAMVLKVRVDPYEDNPDGAPVEAEAVFPIEQTTRKLRRLHTFSRTQGRIGEEMDVEDELRAMSLLARTLDSLPRNARERALLWLNGRATPVHVVEERTGFASVDESLRLAKERVLS